MDIAALMGKVIFSVLAVAIVSFSFLAFFIMGPFKKMKRGERVLMVFAIFGVLAALAMAALQLLFGVLI